ncbi:MAG TPA: hypothetical protein VFW33_03115 [Gemmataceae bacterium]|nr:hypothetical protein [Gemmataceae bacterium]
MTAPLRFYVTEGLVEQIASRVQGGAFPHVAAEAAGIPAEVFQDWMERGSRPGAREPYRSLAERVRHAHGHARCMAEVELRQSEPKAWLLNGPGKISDTLPGWSTAVKGQPGADRDAVNLLLDARVQALLAALLAALEPFPEARVAVAAALAPADTDRGNGGA